MTIYKRGKISKKLIKPSTPSCSHKISVFAKKRILTHSIDEKNIVKTFRAISANTCNESNFLEINTMSAKIRPTSKKLKNVLKSYTHRKQKENYKNSIINENKEGLHTNQRYSNIEKYNQRLCCTTIHSKRNSILNETPKVDNDILVIHTYSLPHKLIGYRKLDKSEVLNKTLVNTKLEPNNFSTKSGLEFNKVKTNCRENGFRGHKLSKIKGTSIAYSKDYSFKNTQRDLSPQIGRAHV